MTLGTASTKEPPYNDRVSLGQVPGVTIVHKYGHNHSLPVGYVPVCAGGFWPTPQVSGATPLRLAAGGDAADTAAGTGAREITIYGLDATGAEIFDVLATNGALASLATPQSFLRIIRVKITKSGTYGTSSVASHVGDITIENSAGGTNWAIIPIIGFPHGSSQIGVFTVPLGKVAYITQISYDVDSGKTVDLRLLKRENILETAPPYSAVETVREIIGISGGNSIYFDDPLGPFPALTDVGFMAQGAVTPAASVDFTIKLYDV